MGVKIKGDFRKSLEVLNKYYRIDGRRNLTRASERLVDALRDNTPVDSGETKDSWGYKVRIGDNGNLVSEITNSAHADEIAGRAAPVPMLLEYGHGTGTGGYVPPTHFVSRTMDDMHDETINDIKAVIKDA